jgi:transcriptional regulator with XRE-family HTH domain
MYPNLRLQLWRRRIRQNQLAKMLEIDETILSRIMNGFRQPGPEMRQQIARLLESDEVWLFETENVADGKMHTGEVAS